MTRRTIIFCRAGWLLGLTLMANGCRTFNYTDEDMARERRQIREGLAHVYSGWGGGWGQSVRIDNIRPYLGNFCPVK